MIEQATHKKKSNIFVECERTDKALWVRTSSRAGKKLEEWVNNALTEAAISEDHDTSWMTFSPSTRHALMRSRVGDRINLIEHIQEDTLGNLEYLSQDHIAEIQFWCKTIGDCNLPECYC